MELEFGRSSYYSNCPIPDGRGEDSIYIKVDGKTIIMNLAMAKHFIKEAITVGQYFGLAD